MTTQPPAPTTTDYSLGELVRYFLRLGTFGFGGPIALVGYMQRDLVERRGWVSLKDYKEGLALAQLAPGPLAAQLAIYLGWLRYGVWGATLVALAFVLPSFVMVLALSALYVAYGGLSWMQGAFYGIGAAVIAIIARSAYKLTKSTLGQRPPALGRVPRQRDRDGLDRVGAGLGLRALRSASRWSRVAGAVTATAAAVLPWPWLHRRPARAGRPGDRSATIAWYFTEAGAFVFGSGLAIVPFLHGGVVNDFGWLTERQFLDAVAVAMITPGPVVITVAFIGYLVAGPARGDGRGDRRVPALLSLRHHPGAILPPLVHDPRVKAFVDGVTAAAAGAIAGAAFVLGRRAIFDVPTVLIALVTLAALIRIKGVSEPLLIVTAGIVGIAVSTLAP